MTQVPNTTYEMGLGGFNMWDLPTIETEGSDPEHNPMDLQDGSPQVNNDSSEEEAVLVLTSENIDYQT